MTAGETLREQVGQLRDRLSFVLLYAPSLPPEDETTLANEVERLLGGLKDLWNGVQDVERRRWLDLLAQEIIEARAHFEGGDDDAGCRLIQSAQERLEAWLADARPSASFIAGPDGNLHKA